MEEEEGRVVDPDLKEEVIRLTISGETERLKSTLLANTQLRSIRDWTGDSLLAIACWQNKYETAKMLVELGFDVDSTNHNGSTPLHRACYRNNIELVILLTNNGATYTLRDKSGRKPADVGDRIVKKVILELERISEEEKERETMAQMEAEHERDMVLAQIHEEERLELVHKRQHQAVPIVIQGGRFHRVNGCYEPVDEIHQDWPVYSLRGDRDIWLLYVGNEWLIQSTKDKGTSKAYVRLRCEIPTYPELRLEGNNGVIESTFSMVLGVPFQFSKPWDSKLTVLTEEEAGGIRASEMFKLAERRNSEPPLADFQHISQGESSIPKQTPSTADKRNRSHSTEHLDPKHLTPLKYEEDELIEHYQQQQAQSNLAPSVREDRTDQSHEGLLAVDHDDDGHEL